MSSRCIADSRTWASPEAEFVARCTQAGTPANSAEEIDFLLRRTLDWSGVFQLARAHKVVPFVYQCLRSRGVGYVPPLPMEEIQAFCEANAVRNAILLKELFRLLEILNAHGVTVISLKGPVHALSLYGDMSFRHNSDLDLLIRKQDLSKIKHLLSSIGYTWQQQWMRPLPQCTAVRKDGLVEVDLHWGFAPTHIRFPLGDERFWQRSEVKSIKGHNVRVFMDEHLLIVLAMYVVQHLWWTELVYIRDLAELISRRPKLDWGLVFTEAEQLGTRRALLVALALAVELFDASVPHAVREQVQSDAQALSLAAETAQRVFYGRGSPRWMWPSRTAQIRYHSRCRERVRERIWAWMCIPLYSLAPLPGDRAVVRLPGWLSFAYFFIRPFRMLALRSVAVVRRYR